MRYHLISRSLNSRPTQLITVSEATHHDLSLALVPGAFLVDVLPARKSAPANKGTSLTPAVTSVKHVPAWLPGAGFQQHAARSRERAWKMAEETYLHVKKAYVRSNVVAQAHHD